MVTLDSDESVRMDLFSKGLEANSEAIRYVLKESVNTRDIELL